MEFKEESKESDPANSLLVGITSEIIVNSPLSFFLHVFLLFYTPSNIFAGISILHE